MKINDVILQTVSKIAVFIIALFAIYLFFTGHHQPGGGFIGGLTAASALVLLYIAFDLKKIDKMIKINFRVVTAIGLLLAVGTGVGSFLFDVPFLTQTFGYFQLPLFGETELATAVIFDIGVFLTVVGVTMTIILSIGKDDQSWKS